MIGRIRDWTGRTGKLVYPRIFSDKLGGIEFLRFLAE